MNSLTLLDDNVIFGKNSLLKLKDIIKNKKYKKLLLITGKNSFVLNGAKDIFTCLENELRIIQFSYSGEALPIDDVNNIYKKVKRISNIDLILGIGGGTVLDIAKIISLLYSNKINNTNDILGISNLRNNYDLILIPTTAGSGSETTNFAVVYKDRQKYSIVSENFNIKYTILDSLLLKSLPINILKITILDALSQSIESIWARKATKNSRKYAKAALEILHENLFELKSFKNLDAFLLASHLAGKAINISKTTASHAISYPLTAQYGIPHGLAVYLTLPQLAELNFSKMSGDHSAFKMIFKIFNVKTIDMLVLKMENVFTFFEFDRFLTNYHIEKSKILDLLISSINLERLNNNPVKLTHKDIKYVINKVY
jgi:alcohol dehydrogenase